LTIKKQYAILRGPYQVLFCGQLYNDMNFPLLKTFTVDDNIVKFLNQKFDYYSSSHQMDEDETAFNNESIKSGYQTSNLLYWEDLEYKNFLNNELLEIISRNLSINKNNIEYFWTHMLEYQHGGKMDSHKHSHNEDFVIFIYLKTCKSGQTVFYLNDHCEEYMERTSVELLPVSGLGAIFSSLVLHKGKFTKENKRIFVAGVRVSTNTH